MEDYINYRKSRKKKGIISVSLTLFIISMLVFSGPASAVWIQMESPSGNTYSGETVTFKVHVVFQTYDLIPISTINVTNLPKGDLSFSADGTQLSGSDDYDVTLTENTATYQQGYGYYGYGYDYYGYGYDYYGYGYDYYGYGYDYYGYGYDYYGYGYGYDSTINGPSKLTYEIKINNLPVGAYDQKALIEVITDLNQHIFSETKDYKFNVIPEPTGSTISIGSATVNPGDTVVLPITLADVTDVTGVDVTIVYDANIVIIQNVAANSSVSGSSVFPNIDNKVGKTTIAFTNTEYVTATSVVPIIDITFEVVGSSGSSTLELQEVEFSDALFNVYDPDTIKNGEITIATPLTCDYDMCVNTTGWWNASGEFNACNTSIQHTIDNATAGNTIYVYNGNYIENVNIGTSHLTLRGEGMDVVTVTNSTADSHVFNVIADYVNISGFNVTGATGLEMAGIYLSGGQHCNISNNTASGNNNGIYLNSSSNYNTLTNNTVSNNDYGILLKSSSNNTLTNNTASNNIYGISLSTLSNNNILTNNTASNNSQYGILLYSSCNDNTLTNNTANSNTDYGIFLVSSSNYNTLTNNTASGNNYGIYLYSSSNYNILTNNNTLTNNTVSNNDYGIFLVSSSNNTLTNNTASNNSQYGILLYSSSSNTIYNNYFSNTNNAYDNGNNIWNTTSTTGTNIIGGSNLGGNYWSDYEGTDTIGDGLGDTLIPYNSSGNILIGGDYHPLTTDTTPPTPPTTGH